MRPRAGRVFRHRVAVRPKLRRRRLARAAVVSVLAALAVAATLVVKNFPIHEVRLPNVRIGRPVSRLFGVERIAVAGVSRAMEPALMNASRETDPAQWGPLEPYRVARRLESDFPWLEAVRVRRSWWRRSIVFEALPRRPVARVAGIRGGGWLDGTGTFFQAPSGVYPEDFTPRVDVSEASASDYLPLAQFLQAAAKEGPGRVLIDRWEFRSAEEGWEGLLKDGTRLLWGGLSWTDAKLRRLSEVFRDARDRFGPSVPVTVDLRYFGDGKILARPGVSGF